MFGLAEDEIEGGIVAGQAGVEELTVVVARRADADDVEVMKVVGELAEWLTKERRVSRFEVAAAVARPVLADARFLPSLRSPYYSPSARFMRLTSL